MKLSDKLFNTAIITTFLMLLLSLILGVGFQTKVGMVICLGIASFLIIVTGIHLIIELWRN